MKAIKPKLPFIPIYLVESQQEVDEIKYLKGYIIPNMGTLLQSAATLHIQHVKRMQL